MSAKRNCWDFKNCGRENGPSGATCPAAIDTNYQGLNGGENGGRICWTVAGTFCAGKVQGTFGEKIGDCIECDFFNFVKEEEGSANFVMLRPG